MRVLGWGKREQRGPFAALLLALIVFIALVPVVDGSERGGLVMRVGFTAVLIAGLGVARGNRRFLAIGTAMLLANIAVHWLSQFLPMEMEQRPLMRYGLGAAYLGYLILILTRALSQQRDASLDTVLGGINIYLLLAILFMQLHLTLEHVSPGSYMSGGLALTDAASPQHGSLSTTLLYFSFTTLTTLGYGDIAPMRPCAQFLCSAEAVIGQLFVAIFIGGLVALWISGMNRE